MLEQLFEAISQHHHQMSKCIGCGFSFYTDDPMTICPNCGVYINTESGNMYPISEGARDQIYRENAIATYRGLMTHVMRFKGRFSESFNIKGTLGWDLDKILGGQLGNRLSVYLDSKSGNSSKFFIKKNKRGIVWALPISDDKFNDHTEMDRDLNLWMKTGKLFFIHEYIHSLDYRRLGRDKFVRANTRKGDSDALRAPGSKAYFASPAEWNAYFQEISASFFLSLDEWDEPFRHAMDQGKPGDVQEMASWVIGADFKEFTQKAQEGTEGIKRFVSSMNANTKRRFKKRLYQTWQDLQKYIHKNWLSRPTGQTQ